jgi:hypothetical protein
MSGSARASRGPEERCTDPELRARLRDAIQAGDRGGRPGSWSARKSQLLTTEYEAAGGGYLGEQDAAPQHPAERAPEDGRVPRRAGHHHTTG